MDMEVSWRISATHKMVCAPNGRYDSAGERNRLMSTSTEEGSRGIFTIVVMAALATELVSNSMSQTL